MEVRRAPDPGNAEAQQPSDASKMLWFHEDTPQPVTNEFLDSQFESTVGTGWVEISFLDLASVRYEPSTQLLSSIKDVRYLPVGIDLLGPAPIFVCKDIHWKGAENPRHHGVEYFRNTYIEPVALAHLSGDRPLSYIVNNLVPTSHNKHPVL